MAGIKETVELLKGLRDLALDAKKVLADGAVTLGDLPVAVSLLGQLGTLTSAIQGVSDIPTELKDLSADEINELVSTVLEMVAAVKAA